MTEELDFSKSEHYTLSIRLSTDGFSFSVFNPLNDGGCLLREQAVDESLSMTANLKRVFRETEWLNRPFRRVNVLASGKRYALVPLELFEDEQAEFIFSHNHLRKDNEQVLYNVLHKNDVVVLFGIDKSACNFLRGQYPDRVKFFAQVAPLVEYFSVRSRLGNSRKLYAHLRREAIDLFAYERGRLLLANSFDCRETADRLYYLLYVWKQLGFEQERDELHLAGDIGDKERLLDELRQYLRQVFVMNPSADIDLQAIASCE